MTGPVQPNHPGPPHLPSPGGSPPPATGPSLPGASGPTVPSATGPGSAAPSMSGVPGPSMSAPAAYAPAAPSGVATGPSSAPTPPRPQVWLDTDPLRSSWRAPRRGHPWRWIALGLVLVLVAAASVIALVGGFAQRTDDRIVVEPGTVVEVGPYQLELTRATARATIDPVSKKIREWEIRVIGTGRTTADVSGNPFSSWMALGRGGTGIAEAAFVYQVGGVAEVGAQFQPGMPMTTMVLGADFPADFEPDGKLNVIISRVVLRNNSASGSSSGLVYGPGRQYYFFTLPLTVLQD